MAVRQSVCIPMVFGTPDIGEDDFRRLRQMGFSAVEFWERGDLEDFRRSFTRAKAAGLEIAGFCGHSTDPLRGMAGRENHPAIEKELAESIRVAGEFGIGGLICLSGNSSGKESGRQGLENCARIMEKMAPLAEREGVNLNMELLNSRIDHPGYLFDRTEKGVALCRMVDSTRVKLLYDIYHMQIMEGDIIRTLKGQISHIGHFHTAGVPGRSEMDLTQELNYRAIAAAIDETDYDLFVGHEYRPVGDIWSSLERTAGLFGLSPE